MTAPDPLAVECPWKYCRSKIGQTCSSVAQAGPRRGDWVERKPHAARVRAAEKKEKEESRG